MSCSTSYTPAQPPARNWPFPSRLLDYPSLPPAGKPYRAPQPRPTLPADLPPALF